MVPVILPVQPADAQGLRRVGKMGKIKIEIVIVSNLLGRLNTTSVESVVVSSNHPAQVGHLPAPGGAITYTGHSRMISPFGPMMRVPGGTSLRGLSGRLDSSHFSNSLPSRVTKRST